MIPFQQILCRHICRADRFARRPWRRMPYDVRQFRRWQRSKNGFPHSLGLCAHVDKGSLLPWEAWPCQEELDSCSSACLLLSCIQNGISQSSSSAFALPHASVIDGLHIQCQLFRKCLKLLLAKNVSPKIWVAPLLRLFCSFSSLCQHHFRLQTH